MTRFPGALNLDRPRVFVTSNAILNISCVINVFFNSQDAIGWTSLLDKYNEPNKYAVRKLYQLNLTHFLATLLDAPTNSISYKDCRGTLNMFMLTKQETEAVAARLNLGRGGFEGVRTLSASELDYCAALLIDIHYNRQMLFVGHYNRPASSAVFFLPKELDLGLNLQNSVLEANSILYIPSSFDSSIIPWVKSALTKLPLMLFD